MATSRQKVFPNSTVDAAQLRRTFGCFPSGVTAVCAIADSTPVGMAVSSFTSVSLEPPLVSVCIAHGSSTWPRLRNLPRIGVSVLGEGHGRAARQLAARDTDRFADLGYTTTPEGALLLHGSAAWLDCSLYAELPAGDHLIALLEIHGHLAVPDTEPLVFHGSRFRKLAADSDR